MKLLSLNISSFRGVQSVAFNPNGKNVNIYGQNGTGKTSTEDAFLWLLFGKDSSDKKDFDLIPHVTGTTEPDIGNGKEPTVEAALEYFGKTVKLKKAYLEEWPKKGELKGQYAGSKVHYYVDDLEVKAGEYQQVVSELVDDKLFKLITNPSYFSEVLSWQDRRETLVKIAGELNAEPAPALVTLMGDRNFTAFHALAKQNVKATQKQLDGLPFAITEARRQITTDILTPVDIDGLRAEKTSLEEKLQTVKNDDSANVRRREIAQIETWIAEARNRYIAAIDADNAKIKAGIEKFSGEQNRAVYSLGDVDDKVKRLANEIEIITGIKANKLAEYNAVFSTQWTGADMCPTCGQSLPAEMAAEAKAAFNLKRSEELERLKTEGLALRTGIETKTAEIAGLKTEADELTAALATLSARIEKGRSMVKPYAFEETLEYVELRDKRNALILDTVSDGAQSVQIAALTYKIQNIEERIDAAGRVNIQIEQRGIQEKRVADLMAQEKQINADLANYEKAVSLCEQHVKKQAKALEQAVNGKFKIARFRMFQMQKNGEEAECCDVIYPNGSTTLSTGERLQVGIDMINTLTDFYGVDAPIWIDNAEGVTKPIESTAQMIKLFVCDGQTELRIEVEA